MPTKYFILNNKEKLVEVTADEHSAWAKENAQKYNLSFSRKDGSKDVTLVYKGVGEPNKRIALFSVRSVFSGFDGEIINDWYDEFDNYEEAKNHYELDLVMNGDM